MTQDQVQLLLFKVVLVAGITSIAVFVADYHRMTRGGVWRNEIGKTIVIKDILLIACMTPSVLSLFFHLSRLTSRVAGWTDIVLFGLLPVVMTWRVKVWRRVHNGKAGKADAPGPPGKGAAP